MNQPWPALNPTEFCMCGCGQKTAIAACSDRNRAMLKGQPLRYIKGHQARKYLNDIPEGFLRCGFCKETLPLDAFSASPRKKNVGPRCKACVKAWNRDPRRWERHRDLFRDSYLKRRFGMLLEDYEDLHTKQNGLCAICGLPETSVWKGRLRSLAVDHDHKTGRIRGLLCANCNNGLGRFKDDPKVTQRATNYLLRHLRKR